MKHYTQYAHGVLVCSDHSHHHVDALPGLQAAAAESLVAPDGSESSAGEGADATLGGGIDPNAEGQGEGEEEEEEEGEEEGEGEEGDDE